MFYKIRNILGVSALALMVAANCGYVRAQGVVTLSEDAMFDDDEGAAPSVPENAPLFGKAEQEQKIPVVNSAAPVAEPTATVETQPATPVMPAQMLNQPGAGVGLLGTNDDSLIDDEVFAKMSDLEKQTALLNLELRREKVQNEIEAIKNQRKQAVIQEQEKAEEQQRKKIEWEKEQEQKVLQEQEKLRELDIQFEKIRQEKLLNAYKNDMLAATQEWISHDATLYQQIDGLKKENQAVLDDTQTKLKNVKASILSAAAQSSEMINAYNKEIDNLQTQISILKARIEAQEREIEKRNPFADGADLGAQPASPSSQASEIVVPELKLQNMYAVMEIRGQNGELIAKLINQDGTPFYVKKGTTLQSGHVIDDITSTYVRAEKDGLKDYLYFAAGGILPLEQPKSSITPALPAASEAPAPADQSKQNFASSVGIPGLGQSMMAR